MAWIVIALSSYSLSGQDIRIRGLFVTLLSLLSFFNSGPCFDALRSAAPMLWLMGSGSTNVRTNRTL